ncbi:hypothetical protein HPP92_025044 [Vanilla planifolia]|uniref:Uncharacterized protein n=1 Tax=Vanilla planifolia TaxID=51239 RepID=A0A835PH49_VANPL|nr:hypothetical protein HPP92_025044 [Vanilla planifolia]
MDDFFAAEYRRRQTAGSNRFELSTSSGDGSSPISDVDNILASSHSTDSCSSASAAVVPEIVDSKEEKKKRWDRLQAYDRWIWSCFYSTLNAVKNYKRSYMESLTRCESCHDLYWRDEKHCKLCHTTFEMIFDLDERDFPAHKVLPSQLQALKAAVHVIEGSMPAGAFSSAWKSSAHKLWVKRLRRTSSLPELLQVLADLVTAMNEEWLYENVLPLHSAMPLDEVMAYFQTMPQTTSAVALWIVKLDRLIAPYLEKVQSKINLPCRPRLKEVVELSLRAYQLVHPISVDS